MCLKDNYKHLSYTPIKLEQNEGRSKKCCLHSEYCSSSTERFWGGAWWMLRCGRKDLHWTNTVIKVHAR